MAKPLVFVSYAHAEPAEAALAGLIAERLRRDGAEVFFDQRLRTGQDWNAEIERGLDACDAFCPLLSAASLASPMVQAEIARVGERRRRDGSPEIWPLRCRFDGRLPYDIGAHLRRIQYLTWHGDADTAFALDELLDRWRELRDGPQPEPPPPTLCTLPGRIADFTGREPEIADLVAALCREDRRAAVSAIGGMGGAGKTTLAIEAAWRMADRFPDGIMYVDMLGFGTAPPLTSAQAIAAVIEQLEPTAKLPDRLDQLLPRYRRLLAGRKLLLLLDNARETAQVADLVPPPPVALLVTSRHQIFLDGGTRLDLDVMRAEEAHTLLRGTIDDRRATDAELGLLAERCGWLPLALRAAVAYLQFRVGLPVEEYLALLAEEKRRLDHLKAPQAARDVRATLNLSASLLDTDDPELGRRWRLLAVFPSAFRPDAAAAIWGTPDLDASELLDPLVSRSLLGFERETNRYRLHDLARTVAGEGLDAELRLRAEVRHAEYYFSVLKRAEELYDLGGKNTLAGLALFDEERVNIFAGHAWAVRHHRSWVSVSESAADYLNIGIGVLSLRLLPRELLAWFQDRDTNVLASEERMTVDRWGVVAKINRWLPNLGFVWANLGEPKKAMECYEQGLEIARETGDRRGESLMLGNMGAAWADLGEARKAIELLEQSLAINRAIGNRSGEGIMLGNLGAARLHLGETRTAIDFLEQSLAIARETGELQSEGSALANLGDAWTALGETRKALDLYEQSLAISRKIADRVGAGSVLWNLALSHDSLGDAPQATRYGREFLVLLRKMEHPFTPEVEAWLCQRGVDPGDVRAENQP